jgi:hypothetical protein
MNDFQSPRFSSVEPLSFRQIEGDAIEFVPADMRKRFAPQTRHNLRFQPHDRTHSGMICVAKFTALEIIGARRWLVASKT